jgi:hypothetical protein
MAENKWIIYGVLGAAAIIAIYEAYQYLTSGSTTAANSTNTSSQGGTSGSSGGGTSGGGTPWYDLILPAAIKNSGSPAATTPQAGGSTQGSATGASTTLQGSGSTQTATAYLQQVANNLTGTVVAGSGLIVTQSSQDPSLYTYQSGGKTVTGSIPGSLLTSAQSAQAAVATLQNLNAQGLLTPGTQSYDIAITGSQAAGEALYQSQIK